ncbi:MAG: hypothetical protein ACPGUV_06865 [Polyangiales bacterium]
MRQWFRGRLEGHYVGIPVGRPGVSQFGSAARFQLQIYRALIRDIEVLGRGAAGVESEHRAAPADEERSESLPPAHFASGPSEPPIDLPDDCFYQAKIEQARLVGLRPGSCFEGPVYNIAVSRLQVTHQTKHRGKTYGRLVGEIYGRCLLPQVAEPEDAAAAIEELTATEPPVTADAQGALTDVRTAGAMNAVLDAAAGDSAAEATAGALDAAADAPEDEEPLHAPEVPTNYPAPLPSKAPPVVLAVIGSLALGMAGGVTPVLLWLGMFVPMLIMRVLLEGVLQANAGLRMLGAALVLLQTVCMAGLALAWWQTGCKAIDPWLVTGVTSATLVASLLPMTLPLMCTGTGFAVVLLLWFGPVGIACDAAAPRAEPARAQPSVRHPGVPRTNPDGTWPRRSSAK